MTTAPKPFALDGSEYDLLTYWGRVSHFARMVDLRNNFISDEQLQRCVDTPCGRGGCFCYERAWWCARLRCSHSKSLLHGGALLL